MTCDAIEARLEEVASGESVWSHDEEAHVSACVNCQARLALARDIARMLPALAVEPAPASFTADVMARVRRERWRAEQALDVGFNVAIAAGLFLVISGVVGLAWASGLIVVGADVVGLMRDGLSLASAQVAPQLPFYAVAALLLTLGLGVWWWTEGADAHW